MFREKQRTQRRMGTVKKAMTHAQAKSEDESKEKDDDDNASQALQRSNMSETKREWMNQNIKKHNNR
jgi:hypothetical protein